MPKPSRIQKSPEKMFIVRKYIMAPSAIDAIKREVKYAVDDVWLDEDWKKQQQNLPDIIGFEHALYED